jgi:hypothetical protein
LISVRSYGFSPLVTALLGFLSIMYALFGPIYTIQSSSGQTTTASLFQLGGPGASVIPSLLLLGFIGNAVGIVLHSRTREDGSGAIPSDQWLILVWVSWGATACIVAWLYDIFPLIAPFLLPSTLLALLASIFSSLRA